jgi:peptidoglycan/LPS O-acetylase OafA/YrhL
MPDIPAPQPSLIQQRMALERKSRWAIGQLVISLVLAAGWVVVLITDTGAKPWPWIAASAFLALAIACVFSLAKARRDTRVFEQQHGADAGVQEQI